jgi:hypothetical protein
MLGEALRGFAAELRLTDAADLAAFIRLEHLPNLQCIVRSSAELHFKPGTLDLAEAGELELGWSTPPLVILPMIFSNDGVFIYFRLRLAALTAAIEVESIHAPEHAEGEQLHRALSKALKTASLSRTGPHPV